MSARSRYKSPVMTDFFRPALGSLCLHLLMLALLTEAWRQQQDVIWLSGSFMTVESIPRGSEPVHPARPVKWAPPAASAALSAAGATPGPGNGRGVEPPRPPLASIATARAFVTISSAQASPQGAPVPAGSTLSANDAEASETQSQEAALHEAALFDTTPKDAAGGRGGVKPILGNVSSIGGASVSAEGKDDPFTSREPAAVADQPDSTSADHGHRFVALSSPFIPEQDDLFPERPSAKPPSLPVELAKRGLVVPPGGDLTLEISGIDIDSGLPDIYVMFQSYPRSLHKKPMSIEESRRAQRLVLKMVLTTPDTIEAVLTTAADGIYDFRAASPTSDPIHGNFSIAFNAVDSPRKRRAIGAREIGKDVSIVKILMPEGIAWDEDAAFDGSMEDTDSKTKYQSGTGLVWKEYKRQPAKE